jgi:N-carbamoyl-L-amino-acid hydrolase
LRLGGSVPATYDLKRSSSREESVLDARIRIDGQKLLAQLRELGDIGLDDQGGRTRLALTEADKAARDWLVSVMHEIGLAVQIDRIGNVFGSLAGRSSVLAPLMMGSHIDTVTNAGALDGTYGVLAGLAVARAFKEAGVVPPRSLLIGAFTNEEGVRYQPDMLGSLVVAGGLPLEAALSAVGSDGTCLGEQLARIGYAGNVEPDTVRPWVYLELHIEQGPVLEADRIQIGVVTDLQGISWQEVTVQGRANHAGTTPLGLRHDSGYVASAIVTFLRQLALDSGGTTLATVGRVHLEPDVINVIARYATLSVDLRDPDEQRLRRAERRLADFMQEIAAREGVSVSAKPLARSEPVRFDFGLLERIAAAAGRLGLSHRRMTSGAGHDAQMMARIAPAAMIFVPSAGGVSHNPREHTDPVHLLNGAQVLLEVVLDCLGDDA